MSDPSKSRVVTAFTQVLTLLDDNLGALTASALHIERRVPMSANCETIERLLGAGRVGRITCKLEGIHSGKLMMLWPLRTLIALTGGYRSTPEAALRTACESESWTDEDDVTFEEVAVLMTASIQEAVKATLGDSYTVEVECQELCESITNCVDEGVEYFTAPFSFSKRPLTPTRAAIILPLALAQKIEGAPIDFDAADDIDDFDDFEAAEIRGSMAAFVNRPDAVRMLRKSCRRVGLDFDKRPKSEVPNPACYSGFVVVIEIGMGQARKYEWCRRLKRMAKNTQVVLLVHKPTRAAIARAFSAGADGVLCAPAEEREVSQKIIDILESVDQEEGAA